MAVTVDAKKGAYIIPALAGSGYVPLTGGTMTGALTLPAGAVGTPSLMFTGAGATTGIYSAGSNDISFAVNGSRRGYFNTSTMWVDGALGLLSDTGILRFGSSSASDPTFFRSGVGAIYLRPASTTTACTFYISGLYTDASNYERLTLSTTAGTSVNITAESLGTGADNLSISITPSGTGSILIPTQVSLRTGSVLGFVNLDFSNLILRRGDGSHAFGMLAFGGITSTDPGLKRTGALLQCRLSDDSGNAGFSALYVTTPAVAFAALTAAATAGKGARAFINDGAGTVFGVAAAGGGANNVPVYSDGTNWIVG